MSSNPGSAARQPTAGDVGWATVIATALGVTFNLGIFSVWGLDLVSAFSLPELVVFSLAGSAAIAVVLAVIALFAIAIVVGPFAVFRWAMILDRRSDATTDPTPQDIIPELGTVGSKSFWIEFSIWIRSNEFQRLSRLFVRVIILVQIPAALFIVFLGNYVGLTLPALWLLLAIMIWWVDVKLANTPSAMVVAFVLLFLSSFFIGAWVGEGRLERPNYLLELEGGRSAGLLRLGQNYAIAVEWQRRVIVIPADKVERVVAVAWPARTFTETYNYVMGRRDCGQNFWGIC